MKNTISPFNNWVKEYRSIQDRIKQLEDALRKIATADILVPRWIHEIAQKALERK